jgi:glucokinase
LFPFSGKMAKSCGKRARGEAMNPPRQFSPDDARHIPSADAPVSVVAVDLGGSKLSSAIVDSSGRMRERRKTAVVRGNVPALIDHIAAGVRDSIGAAPAQKPIRAVGVIVPGIYFAGTGNVWLPNLWGNEQIPLRRELEGVLKLPVVIDSDRAGYVLGEHWLGVARGSNNVVFVAVGTGIGAGILMDGRLIRGAEDIAGAVGWLALNRGYRPIYEQVGCFEAEAAGPGLARRGNARSAEDVIAAARAGEAAAQAAVDETAEYLGMGIANIISLLNPEMVVLGGGLMQAADVFMPKIKQVVRKWAQPIAAEQARIEVTALGEDAGLLGAARLALASIGV